MKIDYLVNHPEKIEEVSRMIYEAFVVPTGSERTMEEVKKYFSSTYKEQLPITLIALDEGECIGTVSLFENDLINRKTYKPWLASLYTIPKHRGCGVGGKLVDKTVEVCKKLKFDQIFLRTESASDYYESRGWTFVETVEDHVDTVDVFKVHL
ncbi:GNAT family N-acetyltransferase [Halobacillus yeomjeoni]|uniref:GNAT family N-acetyltransferase n=1 Tax=Halobacillus yeomjeoni TaxID=311194 RepID=A0A931HT65_9BACI|nr:GNAT family N-acetyltransferase [Halobacillus yeomjeoni]MBH0229105.1 GNAT family N-acetyltransferase [Halobacillus yeomjeoni]